MPTYAVSMLALVHLILQGSLTTYLQWRAFCLTTVPTLFTAGFFLSSVSFFFLLDSLISPCAEDVSFQPSAYVIFHQQGKFAAAGLAVLTHLYSGTLILIQHTPLCCPLTSVCIWLTQGDGPQHLLWGWLSASALPVSNGVHLHVVYFAVIRQSNTLPCVCRCQCPRMLLVWEICFFTLVFSLYWYTYTPLTNHISSPSKASPFACSTNKFSLSLLNWSWRELHICLIVFSLCKGKVPVAKQLLSQY